MVCTKKTAQSSLYSSLPTSLLLPAFLLCIYLLCFYNVGQETNLCQETQNVGNVCMPTDTLGFAPRAQNMKCDPLLPFLYTASAFLVQQAEGKTFLNYNYQLRCVRCGHTTSVPSHFPAPSLFAQVQGATSCLKSLTLEGMSNLWPVGLREAQDD